MTDDKKRVSAAQAWREARALMWTHRQQLGLGLLLMLVSRVSGLVLPYTPKFLIDDVIGKHQTSLLVPLALAVAGAHSGAGPDRRSRSRRWWASPRSAPSPTCASAFTKRSRGCRCATSIRRRPAF